MKKTRILVFFTVLIVVLFCACGVSQTSDSSCEPAGEKKTDSEYREWLKSGLYTVLETDRRETADCLIDFNFATMTYWAGFPKVDRSDHRTGPLAVKNGFLYSIRQGTNELTVFRIVDDHTLIYSADRSAPLTINRSVEPVIVRDDAVFIPKDMSQSFDCEKSVVLSDAPETISGSSGKTDQEWLQILKSGNYVIQAAGSGADITDELFFRFRLEDMLFSASYLRYEDHDNAFGCFAVKDSCLYAISFESALLFVFTLKDDGTLVYSADMSNDAANDLYPVEDAAVFSRYENPWETYSYKTS